MIKRIISIKQDKNRLLSNLFSLSLLQIFTYVLPLITLPYLVKVLSIEKYGSIVFAQSCMMFFIIFTDYGFNLSATREIAVNRDHKEKLTEIFSSILILKAILLIFAFFILCLGVNFINILSVDKELFYYSFLFVVGQTFFPTWFFQGIEKMKYITIVNISSKIFFTILIFIFVKEQDDYLLVPILNGIGSIVGTLYSFWIINHSFRQKIIWQSLSTLKMHFIDSSQYFLSRVSVSLYTSANTFILGLCTNSTLVGYYSVAEKLYQAIQSLYSPLIQVLYPYISKEKNITLFKKVFYIVISLNVIGVILVYFLGGHVFDILFSEKINESSLLVFHILLLANIITVPSILLGYPFLGALGFSKAVNNSVIIGAGIHLVGLGIIMLTDHISVSSVAIMVVLTELTVLTIRLYSLKCVL